MAPDAGDLACHQTGTELFDQRILGQRVCPEQARLSAPKSATVPAIRQRR